MSKTKKQAVVKPTETAATESNIPTSAALAPIAPEPSLPSRQPSASMVSMFAPSAELMTKLGAGKIRRLTLPPIIKPAAVGPGTGFQGRITGVIDSPVSTYKSKLLKMVHPTGGDFCWPANAVTCGSLANYLGIKRESLDLDDQKTIAKLVGLTLLVQGLGPTRHSDGKRNVNLYNIAAVLE